MSICDDETRRAYERLRFAEVGLIYEPKPATITIYFVRCGECKYRYVDGDNVRYNLCLLGHNKGQADDWFCADGEKREEQEDETN